MDLGDRAPKSAITQLIVRPLPAFLVFLALFFGLIAGVLIARSQKGRYTLGCGQDGCFRLDTVTGEAWRMSVGHYGAP